MATQPRAILFDLDNTLTNRRASVTAFARDFFRHFRTRHQMTRIEDVEPIIQNVDSGGYRPPDERWRMLQRWIPWIDKPAAEEIRDYWYTQLGYRAIGVDSLHDTLTTLKQQGIMLGIITNGPEGLQNLTIDTLNVRQYMDTVIVSDTVGCKKPDAEIYHIALSELGLQAEDVWFVGDNPATDLVGAYRLGMMTVWIQGYHEWTYDDFYPDYTFDTIAELLPLF